VEDAVGANFDLFAREFIGHEINFAINGLPTNIAIIRPHGGNRQGDQQNQAPEDGSDEFKWLHSSLCHSKAPFTPELVV
jgi:hypothetical protein